MGWTCPVCDRRTLTIRAVGLGFLVYCERCGFRFHTTEASDYEEAYAEASNEENIRRWLVGSGYIRDPREVLDEVRKYGLDPRKLPPELLDILTNTRHYVAHYRYEPPDPLPPATPVKEFVRNRKLAQALENLGVRALYRFQVGAIEAVRRGENVIVVAPTGAGKSLCFIIPIFERLLQEQQQRWPFALLVYPTKALARDQLTKLAALSAQLGIDARVVDGDTPADERRAIVARPPPILVTNFDMVHEHLQRRDWFSNLIRSVRIVVIDELHTYTGAFGANVRFILYRLRRIAGLLQVIGVSATIRNPSEFAQQLIDAPVYVVEERGGRRSALHVVVLYPELLGQTRCVLDVATRLVRAGRKTLVFANTQQYAERLTYLAREEGLANADVHRGGLPPELRHPVERAFAATPPAINPLFCTTTLELGIDIGDLDAVVTLMTSYTRFLHRAGRAGRRPNREAICVLVLNPEDQLGYYYRLNPHDFFSDVDPAFIAPKNRFIAERQLIAAASDKPLRPYEVPDAFKPVVEDLLSRNLLRRTPSAFLPTREGRRLLRRYNIRGSGSRVTIYCGDQVLGERELPIAINELFPGAIYLIRGRFYRVEQLNLSRDGETGIAILKPDPQAKGHETRALATETIEYFRPLTEPRYAWKTLVAYGEMRIRISVHGFVERDLRTGTVRRAARFESPTSYCFDTLGLVFRAPSPVAAYNDRAIERLSREHRMPEHAIPRSILEAVSLRDLLGLGGAFHAVEHSLIETNKPLTGGGEVGGLSLGTTGVIVIHDAVRGGSGAAELLFRHFEEAVRRSLFVLSHCTCKRLAGCPRCTHSFKCGSRNYPLFRLGALESLLQVRNHVPSEFDFSEFLGMEGLVDLPTRSYAA